MTHFDERRPGAERAKADEALARGRDCYRRFAWHEAYESLARADAAEALGAEDLEYLAMAAYLIGRDDDYLLVLERTHHAHFADGNHRRSARCAFWLGLRLLFRGEIGRATGWLARAQRALAHEAQGCAEHGYLLLPVVQQHLNAGDWTGAHEAAVTAANIGERFRDADLTACARHLQGRALIEQGRVQEGLALLDETMVGVASGKLSPLVTGLIYCSVIESCQQIYALDRAREWTSALAAWCAQQPDMVAFSGTCLVHRSEILQLHGAWHEAIAEARRACARFSPGIDHRPHAAAFYQQAEIHRLRGEFAAAEEAYRSANQWGWEPQPGLALLRLAQGRTEAAAAAIRRAAGEAKQAMQRVRLLPAFIEIMLASGDIAAAREACGALSTIAERFNTTVLQALAAQARGAVALARGEAQSALAPLRQAWQVWQQVDAPYLAARTRVMIGTACRSLGDEDGGELELDAARAAFEELGAAPDVAHIDALVKETQRTRPHGLTARELQVLRRVAAGKTNKMIAKELSLSEKTIDRHVSNIYTKLDVPSRAAATAYAYEHKLI